MEIFNIQIFGETADNFMKLSCAKKKEFVKKNTNQKNDILIDEFLKAVVRGNDEECKGCKDAKANIADPVQEKVAEPPTVGQDKKESNGADPKRRRTSSQDD